MLQLLRLWNFDMNFHFSEKGLLQPLILETSLGEKIAFSKQSSTKTIIKMVAGFIKHETELTKDLFDGFIIINNTKSLPKLEEDVKKELEKYNEDYIHVYNDPYFISNNMNLYSYVGQKRINNLVNYLNSIELDFLLNVRDYYNLYVKNIYVKNKIDVSLLEAIDFNHILNS